MDSVVPKPSKQFSKHEKLVTVELCKAVVPFRKIMKQRQMPKTTLWWVIKAPMQDRKRTCRKATILPNTLKQMKRLLNIHTLLDSQAVKAEGACLVWCKCQVDSEAVQGQAEDTPHEDRQPEDARAEARLCQGIMRLDCGAVESCDVFRWKPL
jgi:hypothetical protein